MAANDGFSSGFGFGCGLLTFALLCVTMCCGGFLFLSVIGNSASHRLQTKQEEPLKHIKGD